VNIETDLLNFAAFIKAVHELTGPARIERVIQNGPATVVFFDDETKQVTKCSDGDGFNWQFGIMWCALRKYIRNRQMRHLEKAVKRLAKIEDPREMRAIGEMLVAVADWMER